jgi:hypothetical protein
LADQTADQTELCIPLCHWTTESVPFIRRIAQVEVIVFVNAEKVLRCKEDEARAKAAGKDPLPVDPRNVEVDDGMRNQLQAFNIPVDIINQH